PTIFKNYDSFECKLMESIAIMNYVFKTWKTDELFICFNGGKDSTVILNLFYSLFFNPKLNCKENFKIIVLYLQNDPMDEAEQFLYQTVLFYNLTLLIIDASEGFIKACFEFNRCHPHRRICLMGNRLTDSESKSGTHFQTTDKDWPKFLRVYPILNFSYTDVWEYINRYKVPYCQLYEKGYTSIGKKSKTAKNENLRIGESSQFLPACTLSQFASERQFR
ncbi:hypothetical protein HZS_6492, partial [Henneguya salminicola]